MRQVKELRFELPGGRWSIHLLPPHDLAPLVKAFWEVHGFGDFARQRILPKITFEVIFNLAMPHRLIDPRYPGAAALHRDCWVSGLQQRPLVVGRCKVVAF
jgi:hypothetical protein